MHFASTLVVLTHLLALACASKNLVENGNFEKPLKGTWAGYNRQRIVDPKNPKNHILEFENFDCEDEYYADANAPVMPIEPHKLYNISMVYMYPEVPYYDGVQWLFSFYPASGCKNGCYIDFIHDQMYEPNITVGKWYRYFSQLTVNGKQRVQQLKAANNLMRIDITPTTCPYAGKAFMDNVTVVPA